MKRYRDFRPTGFDPKGLGLPDRQNWFVAPVCRTRDSGPLDQSNFESLTRDLEGNGVKENDGFEIYRFGHWGPGWFEVVLIDPANEKAVAIAASAEDALENYPILDESDYSERQWNEAMEAWENLSMRERIELCARNHVSIFAARRNDIPHEDNGGIFDALTTP